MGDNYDLWSCLFDSPVPKNYCIQDLQPMTPAYYEAMAQNIYYSVTSDEELKVTLQGVFLKRPDNYDPKNFRWPQLPTTAEASRGIRVYSINNAQQHRICAILPGHGFVLRRFQGGL